MLNEVSLGVEVVMLWFAFIAEVLLEPYSEISSDLVAEIHVPHFCTTGSTHINGLSAWGQYLWTLNGWNL